MADLLWDGVKEFFDPDLMGALPDLLVPGASVEDWFCAFLSAIGRQVAKPVLMSSEGGDGHHPLLGFDVESDRVVLLAEPFENTVRT
ncbi:hypothetical protein APR04_000431 [Promicromonospora umidemergens]|uniref:Uncharacterized protein n=1 Tax=Promicromonospora umidemergens TaxID=629679 RepID=A0ABP8X857_9MICO|nr:hypothetical protein [Promicromonospora umidemergens]MCP2281542.1 hypothetical protein [Promicromonospora umidemergens]